MFSVIHANMTNILLGGADIVLIHPNTELFGSGKTQAPDLHFEALLAIEWLAIVGIYKTLLHSTGARFKYSKMTKVERNFQPTCNSIFGLDYSKSNQTHRSASLGQICTSLISKQIRSTGTAS